MKKIPTLFKRDENHWVYDEVTEGCEWVGAGEGIATVKFDGTSCLIQDGILYKRYTRKFLPQNKWWSAAPDGWIKASDPVHGMGWPGWLRVTDSDKWHMEAFLDIDDDAAWADGTYELVGPKVNGNPHGYPKHLLVRHGILAVHDAPRDFEGLQEWLPDKQIEGIVWHHEDGRMCKIKKRDFGLEWPEESR